MQVFQWFADRLPLPMVKRWLVIWLFMTLIRLAHMAKTSFTSVGSLADSPEPPLRPSPATGHAAEILDV